MEKIQIGGLVLLAILLSSGATYYIQDLGTKTGCRNGWNYVSTGSYEGYYSCQTSSSIRYEVCFEVYNSSNTENYWCQQGKLVENTDTTNQEEIFSGVRYSCDRYNCTRID